MTENSNEKDELTVEEWLQKCVRENKEEFIDYKNSLFTSTDREYLWGIKEYEDRTGKSHRRRSIEDRVVSGFQDLNLLRRISSDLRSNIVERVEDQRGTEGLRSALASLIEFVYLVVEEDNEWLEETIVKGVSNARARTNEDKNVIYPESATDRGVSVDIDINQGYDLDKLESMFREGDAQSVTATELGVLALAGRLREEDLSQIREQQEKSDLGELRLSRDFDTLTEG